MGNLLKKPTPAEEYAENIYAKVNSKNIKKSQVVFVAKTYYDKIQFLKTNPEKINDKNTLRYLQFLYFKLRNTYGIDDNEIPNIDLDLENQWKLNYNNYKKTDEYKKDEEEIKKNKEISRIKDETKQLEEEEKKLLNQRYHPNTDHIRLNKKLDKLFEARKKLEEKLTTLQGTQFGRKKRKHSSFGKHRKWSMKYKRSINCKRPKGFSQKQYCKYGRKK